MKFDRITETLALKSQERVATLISGIQTATDNIVSFALETNSTWPFVTVSSFEARHADFLQLTRASELILVPLVTEEDKSRWENYSVSKQEWIQESFDFYGDTPFDMPEITPFLHSEHTMAHERGTPRTIQHADAHNGRIYAPFWQSSPPTVQAVNLDGFVLEEFETSFSDLKETNEVVLTQFLPLSEEHSSPRSYMLHPIFSSFEDQSKLVGVVLVTVDWRKLFVDALPEGTNGIVVVLSNECGQEYAFQLNGHQAVFFPEVTLNHFETDLNRVVNLVDTSPTPGEGSVVSSYCPYTLHLHSSEVFQETYESNDPLIYTAAVLLIFVLATCLFIVYDCFVERRQESVYKTTARSNALVSSLFPDQVRNRLLDEPENDSGAPTKKEKATSSGVQILGTIGVHTEKSTSPDDEDDVTNEVIVYGSRPIADLVSLNHSMRNFFVPLATNLCQNFVHTHHFVLSIV